MSVVGTLIRFTITMVIMILLMYALSGGLFLSGVIAAVLGWCVVELFWRVFIVSNSSSKRE